jgi:hypothetical protein
MWVKASAWKNPNAARRMRPSPSRTLSNSIISWEPWLPSLSLRSLRNLSHFVFRNHPLLHTHRWEPDNLHAFAPPDFSVGANAVVIRTRGNVPSRFVLLARQACRCSFRMLWQIEPTLGALLEKEGFSTGSPGQLSQ